MLGKNNHTLGALTSGEDFKGEIIMRKIEFGKSGLQVPTIAVGCMRISDMSESEVSAFVDTALENGANFFDHADIYGGGRSEEVFGKAIKSLNREDIIIQTKCGIRKGQFDFSYDHIVNSVDGSLKRLGTEYIDVLLLHRPDALMEPEEVAKAFDDLKDRLFLFDSISREYDKNITLGIDFFEYIYRDDSLSIDSLYKIMESRTDTTYYYED